MQVVFKRSRYQNMHAAVYMIVITVVFLDTCTTCGHFVKVTVGNGFLLSLSGAIASINTQNTAAANIKSVMFCGMQYKSA